MIYVSKFTEARSQV